MEEIDWRSYLRRHSAIVRTNFGVFQLERFKKIIYDPKERRACARANETEDTPLYFCSTRRKSFLMKRFWILWY